MHCEWPVESHDNFHSHTIVKDGERIEYHKCKNCTAATAVKKTNNMIAGSDSLFFGKIGKTVITNGSNQTTRRIRDVQSKTVTC